MSLTPPCPAPGNGTPELCDGLDNDDDGVIDDVDADADGICNCLKIATIGAPGTRPELQVELFGINAPPARRADRLA